MKNFFKKPNFRGFTLVELMIVIAILGIILLAMQYFNANPRIYQEKAERLQNLVHDTIRDTKNNMLIGKISNAKNAKKAEIIFQKGNNPMIVKYYHSDTSSQDENIVVKLDGDEKYQIVDVEVFIIERGVRTWKSVDDLKLIMTRDIAGKAESSRINEPIQSYRITVEYQ